MAIDLTPPKSQEAVWNHLLTSAARTPLYHRAAACLGALLFCATLPCAQAEERIFTLPDCLDLAARQNPDVLAAAKRVEAAKAAVVSARSGVFPALTSSGYYQRREQSIATNGNTYPTYRPNDYTIDGRLTQSLYSAGAVRARIAAAELQEKAEECNHQAALDTAALAVRSAFYQTLYSAALIKVRQQAVDLLGSQVKDERDRFAAGSVGQLNVNRAQVSLVNEEPALEEARYDLKAAYVQLSQALAIPFPDTAQTLPFRIRGELGHEPMKLSLDDCLHQAEAMRPELASRKLAIDALNRQIVVEKSATRPQISAFAAYDLYAEPDLRAVKDNFSGYTIGISASWQIFDGFMTLGRVRSARAQVGVAEALLASMRLQVESDVRTAYSEWQQAEATLRPQTDNIRLANENLDLTSKNFDAGQSTQLEVLQSRVDLTRTEVTELAGRLAYNSALAKLWRAMGVDHVAPLKTGAALPVVGK